MVLRVAVLEMVVVMVVVRLVRPGRSRGQADDQRSAGEECQDPAHLRASRVVGEKESVAYHLMQFDPKGSQLSSISNRCEETLLRLAGIEDLLQFCELERTKRP